MGEESSIGSVSLAGRLRSALTDERLAFLLIAAFALVNLVALDRLPLAHEDESSIAEPGLRFWEHGRLASDVTVGLFGTERHFLLHAPLFTLVTGGVVWLLGPELFFLRLVSLGMAVATAAMTYRVGRTLLSPRHGLLAVLILTVWRLRLELSSRPAGIMLVDLGRIARYDIAVPMFGLMGLLLILPWLLAPEAGPRPRGRLLLAGACAGLATACHPMGLTWIATLCVACVVASRARGRGAGDALGAIAWIAPGTAIVFLPWLAFIFVGWNDFLRQQGLIAERYDVLHARFYASNVINEWRRYGAIGRGLLHGLPGAWLIVVSGLGGAAWLAFGPRRHDVRVRLLRAVLLTGLLLMAIGVQPKFEFYAATLWPWLALTAAVGLRVALDAPSRVLRAAAIGMTILACTDGAATSLRLAQLARATTPYPALCEQVAALLPPGTKLLALPTYWLGLAPHVRSYQSLRVPLWLGSTRFREHGDPSIFDLIAAIDPDVILLDAPMINYLRTVEGRSMHGGLLDYLAAHSVRRAELIDPSYGPFELYYLRR